MTSATVLKPLWPGFEYKAHQTTGIKWMLEREAATPVAGGILCDEMGLGKTIQMLGLLKTQGKSETLLIAPVAVLDQWEATARKSKIAVFRHHVTQRHVEWKPTNAVIPGAARLFLIGYEAAKGHPEIVRDRAWDRLVYDEAQRLGAKNGHHMLAAHITATARWFLTATPIVNGINDLVHILELLGVEKAAADLETLEPLLKEYILARSMNDLRAAIPDAPPPPVEHKVSLPFATEEEAEFYTGMTGRIVKRWKALDADNGAGTGLLKLTLFMRLRQLSLHPQVYIESKRKSAGPIGYERPDWVGSSTKFEEIKRLVASGDNKPHKWIVFCHFHPEMELLKATLEAQAGIRNVWMYHGGMNQKERKKVLEATLEPLETNAVANADILLIQLQSGGVGLNLQHFDRIIFSGPWWTSALMEQAIGRAVRIGQKEVVQVYHLLLKEEEDINIDAIMRQKAETKGDLCRTVLSAACRDI